MTTARIQEYKRTCNKCGKVWHSLVARENDIATAKKINTGIIWIDTCCGDTKTDTIVQRQDISHDMKFRDDLNRLRQCPNCQSTDYKETIVSHAKK